MIADEASVIDGAYCSSVASALAPFLAIGSAITRRIGHARICETPRTQTARVAMSACAAVAVRRVAGNGRRKVHAESRARPFETARWTVAPVRFAA